MKLIMTAAAVGLLLPSAAYAQAGPSAQTTANASAEVVKPLTIGCTGMSFSQLAPLQNASAQVVLPAQGGPLVDNSEIVVPGSRTQATPSNCTVLGELNLTYTVSLPAGATLSNGTATMPLSNFTISSEADANPLDRQLATPFNGAGLNGFGVGATLTVGAAQAPGLYTGQFVVSVQYN
jgi:Mat/Ecp fimbriae major subunit